MRRKAGNPRNQVVPVLAVVPVGSVGLAMSVFENARGKPDDYQIKVALVGGTSTEIVLYGRDANGDWCICADTGNLGKLYGAPLPTGATYIFDVSGLGAMQEIALVTQNNVGPVTVTGKATPIAEGVEG